MVFYDYFVNNQHIGQTNTEQLNKKGAYKMDHLRRMLKDIEQEVKLTSGLIGKTSLDANVMAAMAQVPRHEFVSKPYQDSAYKNSPLPIGSGQTISQPYIVALMTDLLQPQSTDIVLEIGTGSGYQAAVLSRLVRQVYSTEIIKDLADAAQKRLRELNYSNVAVRHSDGHLGWPEQAPYDGILVTAATPTVPEALLDQLREGGRLVIPVGYPGGYQELTVMEKKHGGEIQAHAILDVCFVPMTGQCVRHAESDLVRNVRLM